MKRRREDDADDVDDDDDKGGNEEAEPQPPGTSDHECGPSVELLFRCPSLRTVMAILIEVPFISDQSVWNAIEFDRFLIKCLDW